MAKSIAATKRSGESASAGNIRAEQNTEQSAKPITYRNPTEEQARKTLAENEMFQNAEQYGNYGMDRNDGMINALLNRGEITSETAETLRRYNDKLRKLYGKEEEETPRGLGVATVNPARTATSKRQEARRRRKLDEWLGRK